MFKKLILILAGLSLPLSSYAVNHPDSIKARMMLEHETFLVWMAHEKGWDKDVGLDIDLSVTEDSGIDIISEHKADENKFNITAIGAIPSIVACNSPDAEIVAVANEESKANEIFVRADSEIIKTKGWNEDFPEVYGSPETIKGKEIFVKRMSSGSYLLAKWLDAFYLGFSDVTVKNMNCFNAVETMDSGRGDIMAIWSPESSEAEFKNYKKVADLAEMGCSVPVNFIVDVNFGAEHPQAVAKFLAVYMRAIDYQNKKGVDTILPLYKKFIKENSESHSMDAYPDDVLKADIEKHKLYDYDEQLALFARGNGRSDIQKLNLEISKTFVLKGVMHFDISERLKHAKYVNNKYLFLAKKYYELTKNKD